MATFTDRLGGVRSELAIKAPVRVATTAAITLSGFQTIDGVTLADGDPNLRVLVKNQADSKTNGIYDAQSGNWTRSKDFDGNNDFVNGTQIGVQSGTVNALRIFYVSTVDPIIIGTSNIVFSALNLLASGTLTPPTSDGGALGSSTLMWSDVFLASGGVINFNNGDITITGSANNLLFAGASSGYTFDAIVYPTTNDAAALGDATHNWSDLFLATGGVINWANGGITITEGSDILLFAGGQSYKFDAGVLPTTTDGAALGSTALMWSDLFLASGGVINFNNGNVTITHSSGALASTGTLTSASGTAPAAGGAATCGIKVSSTANLGWYFGTGAPTFSAAKGSVYSNTTATTTTTRLYINTDGGTTWTTFTSAA